MLELVFLLFHVLGLVTIFPYLDLFFKLSALSLMNISIHYNISQLIEIIVSFSCMTLLSSEPKTHTFNNTLICQINATSTLTC